MDGISTGFVCHGIMVDISSGFCLSWTTMIGISTSFVCHEQYWLVCHQVLSV